jgi:hypothetical protein
MVGVFVGCLCCCGWTRDVTSSLYAKKWYKNNLKMRLMALLFDPPRRAPRHTCHNFDWQGATYSDTNIGKVYLRPHKIVIPIKPEENHEGGGVDEGMTVGYGFCGRNRYYKCWMIPVSGQDSENLPKSPSTRWQSN